MADKPSRALVVYGDGLARSLNPSHAHLHSLARRASCGFLSLPHPPPSETEDERILRELAQLLDASEVYVKTGFETDEPELQNMWGAATISERFMGMNASLITNNSKITSFGGKVGWTVFQHHEFCNTEDPLDNVASELLKLLGFQEGKALENNQFDLVLLHIGGSRQNTHDQEDKISTREIDYVNSLVGAIMQVSQPGSEIGSRLHLSVVMSYATVLEEDESSLSVLIEENSSLSLLFPQQSYMLKGSHLRKNIRYHCPMLIAQWQDAVTRKDMASIFSFQEFKENGGNLTIPADRFLHEVAFKLWKAPKYGA